MRADRTAPANAIAARSGAARSGRCGGLCRASQAGAGDARILSRQSAPWRQPNPLRPPPYGRRDLSRCEVSASPLIADLFESVPDARPSLESMAEGAVLLRGFAEPFEADLIVDLRDVVERAPFRHMLTP